MALAVSEVFRWGREGLTCIQVVIGDARGMDCVKAVVTNGGTAGLGRARVLFAAEFDEMNLHLFLRIRRVRVRLPVSQQQLGLSATRASPRRTWRHRSRGHFFELSERGLVGGNRVSVRDQSNTGSDVRRAHAEVSLDERARSDLPGSPNQIGPWNQIASTGAVSGAPEPLRTARCVSKMPGMASMMSRFASGAWPAERRCEGALRSIESCDPTGSVEP